MVMTQRRPAESGATAARRSRSSQVVITAAIGAAVALVDVIGAGIPSYWGDEAASVMSGQRSLPSLLRELSTVDAVHGLYYMLLHVWMEAFGTGEWATRSLSAIAVGALAAGVVTLGSMWFDRRTAVVAGALVAVIPRASSLAIEARGYAITAAAVVWLVVLFAHLLRSDAPRRRWMLFGLGSGVLAWFFLYLLLVPLALCAAVAVVPAIARSSGADPVQLRQRMVGALCGSVLGAVPIIVLAALQRDQVRFLAHRGYLSPKGVLVSPWFSSLPVAVVMWCLIAVGAVVAMRATRQRPAALLALIWLVAPAMTLIAVDVLVSPTYNPRYLAVSLGSVALLSARGITGVLGALGRRPRLVPVTGAVLAAVVLGATVPQYLHQRTPYAKDGGADFRFAAAAVAQRAQAGDAVLFGEGPRPSRTPRLAYRLYPQDFAGLGDPQLVTPYDQRAGLWDRLDSVSAVAPGLRERTVWLLESKGAGSAAADLQALRSRGYDMSSRQRVHRITVYEFTRGVQHG